MNRRFGPPALGEVSQSGNIFFNKNVMSAKISTDINHVGFLLSVGCLKMKRPELIQSIVRAISNPNTVSVQPTVVASRWDAQSLQF